MLCGQGARGLPREGNQVMLIPSSQAYSGFYHKPKVLQVKSSQSSFASSCRPTPHQGPLLTSSVLQECLTP